MGMAGLLGAGMLGSNYLRNASRENLGIEEGLMDRSNGRSFLTDQHNMEMARQRALLDQLRYPALHPSH
jgi:hypothetical protein